MNKLLLTLDEGLPHWLGTPQMQWTQWAYCIWHILRCNALTLLSLPVYLWTICCKKKVLVLGETQDYVMPLQDMMQHRWRALMIEEYKHDYKMCFLKYRECYYFVHTDSLRELAECERRFDGNVVFVEKLLSITGAVSVGKMLSQAEAYEKIFSSQGYHISVSPPYVVPSLLDYVDVSSKFWGVLSTIPLLLEIKNYSRLSNLLSILLILLDLNRHWLYKIYDGVFYSFAKIVKLYIFNDRTYLNHIFSLFSRRWTVSYMQMLKVPIKIRPFCELESLGTFEIIGFEVYREAPAIENLCIEIDMDRAYASLMQKNVLYTVAKLNRPLYVPEAKFPWSTVKDEREVLLGMKEKYS